MHCNNAIVEIMSQMGELNAFWTEALFQGFQSLQLTVGFDERLLSKACTQAPGTASTIDRRFGTEAYVVQSFQPALGLPLQLIVDFDQRHVFQGFQLLGLLLHFIVDLVQRHMLSKASSPSNCLYNLYNK